MSSLQGRHYNRLSRLVVDRHRPGKLILASSFLASHVNSRSDRLSAAKLFHPVRPDGLHCLQNTSFRDDTFRLRICPLSTGTGSCCRNSLGPTHEVKLNLLPGAYQHSPTMHGKSLQRREPSVFCHNCGFPFWPAERIRSGVPLLLHDRGEILAGLLVRHSV